MSSIYQFEMWGKKFAVDVRGGNFFEVDALASEVIELMEDYSREEIIKKLGTRYGHKKVVAAVSNLSKLRRKNLIFCSQESPEVIVKRRITDLTLNIVNSCNLRCRYCWNDRGSYGADSDSSQMMSKQTAFKAIDLLVKESKGARDLVIDFYGGEPLLNFDLIKEVIEYCNKIKHTKKINFRFLLATNATLLTKETGEFLIKNGVDIAVSLDGSRKIQDAQRPFFDGRGSFDAVLENIKSIRQDYRKRLVGRATFTPYSTDLTKTFNFLRNLGFDRIEMCESEKAGYGLETSNQFFFSGSKGLSRLKSIYNKLARFYARQVVKGNLTYENTYFNRFFKQLSRLYHIQSVVGTCSAGFSLMSVDIDGSIYPCTAFVGVEKFKIGNVKCGIKEKKLKDFFKIRISSSESCKKCWARRLCRGCGSCYNLNYFLNKNISQPDPYYCELFRYKTKLMIAMIALINQKNPLLLDKVLIPEYYVTRGKVSKPKKK
ncbi:MAG: hypothetical protein COV73_05220 [Candidatus Omnitrophica bacterium CG11_big_fil_rev_8_21_14_0_20_43_6]|nr:MAG: hypothetical protein COV73_05220 [Candidatus Omnitrophica bacterium CG11_big_fil_rev_8_21_14_0_20_43_6]